MVTALAAKNSTSATKLLEIGAKPAIELGDFMKALKSQFPDILRFHHADQMEERNAKQPILFAVDNDLPLIALDLLRRGVDPNTEIKTRYESGQTVLDRVKNALESLRNFLNNKSTRQRRYWEPKPTTFESDDESYLPEFQQDSYNMFAAKNQLKSAREAQKKAEEREEREKSSADQDGAEEKRKAIAVLVHDYETLEAELLAKDAKTFEEFHPGETQPSRNVRTQSVNNDSTKTPFKTNFEFRVPGLTDTTREGYLQMYAAPDPFVASSYVTDMMQVRGRMEWRYQTHQDIHSRHVGAVSRPIALGDCSMRRTGIFMPFNRGFARSFTRRKGYPTDPSSSIQSERASWYAAVRYRCR